MPQSLHYHSKKTQKARCLQATYNLNADSIIRWLREYAFDAFVTLTLQNDSLDEIVINKRVVSWVRKIQVRERIQVCYLGIISRHSGHSRRHVHLLMTGRSRYGYCLRLCEPYKLERAWKGYAKVLFIGNTELDRAKIAGYLAGCNMQQGSYEILTPYNIKLLKSISSSTADNMN